MKGMKIKSYTFRKNSAVSKDPKPFGQNTQSNSSLRKDAAAHDKLSVDKIIKSPGFNISSKLDAKDINFYENQIKSPIMPLSNVSKKTNVETLNNEHQEKQMQPEEIIESPKGDNQINIKLNINSEVINNNIRITKDGIKHESSDMATPFDISTDKNSVSYYKDIIKEKDSMIESLVKELQTARLQMSKLIQENNFNTMNSFEGDYTRKAELFSERPKVNENNSLLKSMKAHNVKEKTHITTLFRKSNQPSASLLMKCRNDNTLNCMTINTNNNMTVIPSSMASVATISPVKTKSFSVKPIEEILKTTVNLIDKEKMKVQTNKILASNKEMCDNLKMIKQRCQKLLSNYFESSSNASVKHKRTISNSSTGTGTLGKRNESNDPTHSITHVHGPIGNFSNISNVGSD